MPVKSGSSLLKTPISVALNNHVSGEQCGREVAQTALSNIVEGGVSFAFLFVSHPQPIQVLKGVHSVLGNIPLIGATSAGEYSQAGYVEDGAGLMLIRHDDIRFHPLRYQKRFFRMGSLLGKLRGRTEDGLRSVYHHRTLMLFPDDTSTSLNRLVDQAIEETAMLYNIMGGPSPTIPTPPRLPLLFYNNRLLHAGLAGAEILSSHPLGAALANGWIPITGPYRITKVDEHRVIKIDGRPAKEVYEDFAVEQGMTLAGDLSTEFLLHHPIGICQSGDCKVSLVMGFDAEGALRMTSPPPANSLVHILGMQPAAMVTAARRAIQQARAGLDSENLSGALFIDCMSTAMVLENTYQQQRAAVQDELGDKPFLGFRSHGVLARLKGQLSGHYECSVGACVFPGQVR